eukprot:TRINITY_DN2149_c0_g1_i1.p3 TRINITY_DN2149_c0_g1~~TRINITY_DN2149_c0_g1_i1.p3  ORF type:complete len:225 (-),score=40.91 TRINITY_DN2149_c0_g1_i1:223-897(-)
MISIYALFLQLQLLLLFFFFFKQKTAYEIMPSLVGSEMCIRDRRRVHGTVVYNDNDPEGYKKKNFNWDYFTKEFSKEIEKNTKVDIRQTIQSNFSTSGIIEKAAAEITLMRTMEPYFKYKMIKGCGIGSVHFRGTKEDWQLLQEKTINLKKLGMDKQWINAILEIEKEFMNTYEGKVNLDFWNKGLHSGQIAGPSGHMKKSGFTGWLKHFFLSRYTQKISGVRT